MAKKDKEQDEREAQRKEQRDERLARDRERQKELGEARQRKNAERRDQQVLDPTAGNTPLVPTASLAVLVGARSLSYREARRKVSAHIKYNRLQKDPGSKSCVTLDEKLAMLLGAKPGAEVDIKELVESIKAQITPDAAADARRRILQEALREGAAELRRHASRQQEERVSIAEKRRKERDDERRQAAATHGRRVEEEYQRLKGG